MMGYEPSGKAEISGPSNSERMCGSLWIGAPAARAIWACITSGIMA